MSNQSVNQLTLFLGRHSPLSDHFKILYAHIIAFFESVETRNYFMINLDGSYVVKFGFKLLTLGSAVKNDSRNYFMINLDESYVAKLGFKLLTLGSAVRHATDCAIQLVTLRTSIPS